MKRLPRTVLGTVRLHYQQWRKLAGSVPLTTRLFCYSVCLEPFLFFLIIDRLTAGFSLTLARAFQVTLYVILALRGLSARLPEQNRDFPAYHRFIGAFMGLFSLVFVVIYLTGDSYIYRATTLDSDASNAFASMLSRATVRPFIEGGTLMLTVMHYFWIGPRMIRTREHVVFLVLTFVLLSYASLAVGFVNLGSAMAFDQNLVPRHFAEFLYEAPSYSGVRFQGLAGEPRDAFGQLVLFAMVFFAARSLGLFEFGRSAARRVGVLTALAMITTLSASGLAAMVVFGGLFVGYQFFSDFSLKRIGQGLVVAMIITVTSVAALVFIDRFADYVEVYSDIQTDGELSPLALTQFNNIYPLMHWLEMCKEGSVGLCALGGGFGTSFALNSAFYTEGLNNPHSYVSRLLPEVGLVGLVAFILLLLRPAFRRLARIPAPMRSVKIGLLGVVAVSLAHKSNHLYLALLVACLALQYWPGHATKVTGDPARQPPPTP